MNERDLCWPLLALTFPKQPVTFYLQATQLIEPVCIIKTVGSKISSMQHAVSTGHTHSILNRTSFFRGRQRSLSFLSFSSCEKPLLPGNNLCWICLVADHNWCFDILRIDKWVLLYVLTNYKSQKNQAGMSAWELYCYFVYSVLFGTCRLNQKVGCSNIFNTGRKEFIDFNNM